MFDKLPYFVEIKGKKYKINVDFRRIISIEDMIKSGKSNREIIEYTLSNFYSYFYNIEPNSNLYDEMLNKFEWFYRCGKEDYHAKVGKITKQDEVFSYKYDEDLIYAAFMQQYNIDLYNIKQLHWWKFKALLNGLNEDTEFVKIKSYRNYTGDDKQMLELKEYWKLPKSEMEKKRIKEIFDALK